MSLKENTVGLSGFVGYSHDFIDLGPKPSPQLPCIFRTLFSEDHIKLEDDELISLCNETFRKVTATTDQVKYVEELTLTQSNSTMWHDMRLGRITASVAGDVLRTSLTSPAPSLIKKICQTKKSIIAPALEWGRQNEEKAVKLYQNLMHKADTQPAPPSGSIYLGPGSTFNHDHGTYSKSGFIIDSSRPYIGASPDGHITCKCCGDGLLEVKCPFKYKNTSMKSAILDKDFYITTSYQLKEKHQYYAQVQLQMHVCDVQYVDFFIWTPVDCLLTRVERNSHFIEQMLIQFESFWRFSILPELLTRRLEYQQSTKNGTSASVTTVSGDTFCICRSTDDSGEMVACDSCDMWYHLTCLNLKRLPTAKTWYCKECREKKKKKWSI